MEVCPSSQTNDDDFDCSVACIDNDFVLGVRIFSLAWHALLLIACIIHIIRFRTLFSSLWNRNKWKHTHIGVMLISILTLFALSSTIMCALSVAGITGCDNSVSYIFFLILTQSLTPVWMVQAIFALFKMTISITKFDTGRKFRASDYPLLPFFTIGLSIFGVIATVASLLPPVIDTNLSLGDYFYVYGIAVTFVLCFGLIPMSIYVLHRLQNFENEANKRKDTAKKRSSNDYLLQTKKRLIILIVIFLFAASGVTVFFTLALTVEWVHQRQFLVHAMVRFFESVAAFLMLYFFGHSTSIKNAESKKRSNSVLTQEQHKEREKRRSIVAAMADTSEATNAHSKNTNAVMRTQSSDTQKTYTSTDSRSRSNTKETDLRDHDHDAKSDELLQIASASGESENVNNIHHKHSHNQKQRHEQQQESQQIQQEQQQQQDYDLAQSRELSHQNSIHSVAEIVEKIEKNIENVNNEKEDVKQSTTNDDATTKNSTEN